MFLARSDGHSDVPASASLYHPSTPHEHPNTCPRQRRSSTTGRIHSVNATPTQSRPNHRAIVLVPVSLAISHVPCVSPADALLHPHRKFARRWRVHPEAPPGLTISVHADTLVQRALICLYSSPRPYERQVFCIIHAKCVRGRGCER
jgi:hypothetical protein